MGAYSISQYRRRRPNIDIPPRKTSLTMSDAMLYILGYKASRVRSISHSDSYYRKEQGAAPSVSARYPHFQYPRSGDCLTEHA